MYCLKIYSIATTNLSCFVFETSASLCNEQTTERHVEESKKLIDLLEDENNKLKVELTKR